MKSDEAVKGSPDLFGRPRVPGGRSLEDRIRVPTADSAGRSGPGPGSTKEIAAMEEVADKVGFSLREPKYRLADLAISEQCRQALQVLQNRIKHHDVLYQDWGLKEIDPYSAHRAINLYGPPGTGKSMCAEALAAEFGKNIIDIDYAEVESKYVGETPKKIRGAFRLAAETDAVLFFDEADSILGRRMTDVTQAADQSVNVARAVMLKELDRHPGIIIFATNLARNFDAAFIRRILVHVEIPLPDEASRRLIWMRFIPARVPGRDLIDWATLAQNSEGLSGGEIKNAAIIALSSAVARPARLLMMQDLSTAIDHVKRAQRDVGSLGSPLYSPRPVLSTEAVAGRAK